ncbi:MAG TPA: hypothetical protein VH254_06365 [Candidatus Udaeobacter sp.]|nr:hypothetical protein [Candidatus Udaeobacter sp.]
MSYATASSCLFHRLVRPYGSSHSNELSGYATLLDPDNMESVAVSRAVIDQTPPIPRVKPKRNRVMISIGGSFTSI